jgi:hypothetical protein
VQNKNRTFGRARARSRHVSALRTFYIEISDGEVN